jgi:hypothetical protein
MVEKAIAGQLFSVAVGGTLSGEALPSPQHTDSGQQLRSFSLGDGDGKRAAARTPQNGRVNPGVNLRRCLGTFRAAATARSRRRLFVHFPLANPHLQHPAGRVRVSIAMQSDIGEACLPALFEVPAYIGEHQASTCAG